MTGWGPDGRRPVPVCTLTGADDSVDPRDLLRRMAAHAPFAELGVLWSGPKGEGRPRYPGLLWLRDLGRTWLATQSPVRLALHLCGEAERVMGGSPSEVAVPAHGPREVLRRIGFPCPEVFGRFQLNRSLGSWLPGRELFDAQRVRSFQLELQNPRTDGWGCDQIIAQVKSLTPSLAVHLVEALGPNGHVLFDASGGKGVRPAKLRPRVPHLTCGWAGGMDAADIETHLGEAEEAAGGGPFWIDMETSLRKTGIHGEDEGFRLELAEAAAGAAGAWLARAHQAASAA